jgi:molecular chaperone GrpE (heat shock protein)
MTPKSEPDRRPTSEEPPTEQAVLTVKDAKQADASLGYARLDQATRRRLGVDVDHIVELRGPEKVSGARVMALSEREEGGDVIRIDGLVRRNLGVSTGDTITARKTQTQAAQSVTLVPVISEGYGISFSRKIEDFLRRGLVNRPISRGDTVIVPGIALMGGTLPFMVLQTKPEGIVLCDESTAVMVDEEWIQEGETPPLRTRDELLKQLEETRTALQYAQAEVENVRKASDRSRLEYAKQAAWGVLERVLPALDDLDAAVAGLPPEHAAGVSMVRNNLLNALREVGLEEIESDGVQFDPYKHEAVEVITDADLADGTVAKVLRKGYAYNKKVLRPALVAVVKRGDSNGKDNRD